MSHDERDNRPGLTRRRLTQGLAAGAAALAAPGRAARADRPGAHRLRDGAHRARGPAARRSARSRTTCCGPSS